MESQRESDLRPPKHSPWGEVQRCETIAPGIHFVETAGHGGISLSAAWNREIPEPFRDKGGWYEEDCDAAIPSFFLPDHFSEVTRERARRSLRRWHWREWEAHFGEEVPPAESPQKAKHLWLEARRGELITVSAWGDWCDTVPKGKVGVAAVVGGLAGEPYKDIHSTPGGDPRSSYWLVDEAEYATRHDNPAGSITIDPDRHQPWTGPMGGTT